MKENQEFVDEDGVIHRNAKGKRLTEAGQEVPDPRPMQPPVNFKRQPPLHERLRAMVQHEFLRAKERGEYESPEEADDFATGEDVDEYDAREGRFRDLRSFEYEENFDAPEDDRDLQERLIKAGWKPPEKGQQNSAVKPAKSDSSANSVDASQAEDNGADPAPAGSAKQS